MLEEKLRDPAVAGVLGTSQKQQETFEDLERSSLFFATEDVALGGRQG